MSERVGVLFVCMGNICRSPTAEGVFTKLVKEAGLEDAIRIDSAGTHGYHVGASPDERARETAITRGIDMGHLQARQVLPKDVDEFDYVLTMDRGNFENTMGLSTGENRDRIHMFMDFAENRPEAEVPDPYYGGPEGFENVFDMVEEAAAGLLAHIRSQHGL